jgi:chromosome segregation ATPase
MPSRLKSRGSRDAKVYEKCRNAASELQDLGRDVGNAHIVLRNIHRFWELERSRNQDLLIPQQDELKQLAEACEQTLQEVKKIQEKHNDLNTSASFIKRATSKSKWALADFYGDIASAREALQRNTGNLALFHTMLT